MKTDFDPLYKWKYINSGDGRVKENIKRLKAKNNFVMNKMHESFHKQYRLVSNSPEMNNTNNNFTNTFSNKLPSAMTNSHFFSRSNLMTTTSFTNPSVDYYTNTSSSIYTNTMTDFNKIYSMSSKMNKTNKNNLYLKNIPENNFSVSRSNLPDIKDLDLMTKLYHMNENDKVKNKLYPRRVSKEEEEAVFKKIQLGASRQEEEAGKEVKKKKHIRNDSKVDKQTDRYYKNEARCVDLFFDDPVSSLNKMKLNNQIFSSIMNIRTIKQHEKYDQVLEENFTNYMKIAQMPKIREVKVEKINSNMSQKHKFNRRQSMKNQETIGDFQTHFSIMKSHDNLKNSIEDVKYSDRGDNKSKKNQLISRDRLFEKINLLCSYSESKFKPNARSLFTMNLYNDKLIVFGGINSQRLNEIWICDMANRYRWEKLNIEEKNMPTPRHGHTTVLFKNELYIYGGSTPLNYYHTPEDMIIFNFSASNFYTPVILNKSEVSCRRNHVSVTVGNFMFVHGGINNDEKFMSDTVIFEFTTRRWYMADIFGPKPPGLAYHSAQLVLGFDIIKHSNFNVYRFPDVLNNTNKITKIKREGIYVFGGMDENRNYTNDIRILKIGIKPTKWMYPVIHGIPPSGRINATMNFYSELNILLVHGGRNDKENNSIFSDVFILDLEKLNWMKVEKFINTPLARNEHCSVIYEDKLLILGGNNITNLVNFDIFFLSLDLYSSRKLGTAKIREKTLGSEVKREFVNVEKIENPPITTNKILNHLNYRNENILEETSFLINDSRSINFTKSRKDLEE